MRNEMKSKQAEKQKADLDGDDVILWHTERVLR
jgi:hypothetical protein